MASSPLENLIPLVNKLQDLVFNTIGSDTIDLPQVVVVGSQSSGKSSVLENLVGRDFLPRGSGIVTRRPLVLQLINVSPADVYPHGDSEWGEFLHLPGQRFSDFSLIRGEIENETARIAGMNKGINRLPINLKIYSPHVLNLTLVDLPGLTKIPIGDQPTDIERQIRMLISEYIAKPNSIILAVSPANVDLVNSEGLKLARQVDTSGKRTIGVLTKLDLMDHGTNALEILSGRVYPLKLGFIGVVNRSQYDIQENKSLSEALRAEEEFFQCHPAYRNIAHRCGTQYLAKSLNQTLMSHIREKLPDIKARLNALIGQTQQELNGYGTSQFSGKQHRGSLILHFLTKFANSFIASIDGTSSDISTKELCGGARVYYIFNSIFGRELENIDPTHNLAVSDIRTAIRNSTGPRASLFVPELAFDLLVKPQIRLLEAPAQRCVELVYEELTKICHSCTSTELERYPRLQAKLIEVVSDLLRERLTPTQTYVESLISIQGAYINTNHPMFLGGAGAVNSIVNSKHDREKKHKDLERKKDRKRVYNIITRQELIFGKQITGTNGRNTPVDPHEIPNGTSSPVLVSASDEMPPPHEIPRANGVNHSQSHRESSASATASARDSFLNYFFGQKEDPSNSRVVEPSFSHSMRRIDAVSSARPPQLSSLASKLEENAVVDEPQLTEREQMETDLIRSLITSYFNIVRETISDLVPKAVMHFLVNHSKDSVQNRLVTDLYRESLLDDLLFEDEGLALEREKCEKMLEVYKEAARIISEIL
ncbi:Dynamin-related protein DNM1 [Neolecta irregularis DAH-3]|uniref:dynamin GTPase n=1 Tax=Neolecta irregularis (strain DAH-3) TaxID=1198029 RepID=A0A1U7LRP5_NEOID|nr:Dynamin-related protein DNM1 [Neolecta irregularis DAH-3]|eukprot:OLL25191.1 Dynamin-related protein DNM1 [Neolecta irregularis DAH-3]